MEIAIPPTLQPGEKIHFPIFHDECCVHANDQCMYVWAQEGEQPLRNKARGRIVHISDFIIEHGGGRLCLWEFEKEEQWKLPKPPTPPTLDSAPPPSSQDSSPIAAETTAGSSNSAPSKKTKKVPSTRKKASSGSKAKKATPPGRRTLDDPAAWVLPPPPAPFTAYQIPSFDARRIIYPGANYDPWWDMSQLIAQVSVSLCFSLRFILVLRLF